MPDVEVALPIDKIVHFVEYGILSFLLFRCIVSSSKKSVKWIAVTVILCAAALGALDELYQGFTGRNSSVYDWIFDCIGAAASMCLLLLYMKTGKK